MNLDISKRMRSLSFSGYFYKIRFFPLCGRLYGASGNKKKCKHARVSYRKNDTYSYTLKHESLCLNDDVNTRVLSDDVIYFIIRFLKILYLLTSVVLKARANGLTRTRKYHAVVFYLFFSRIRAATCCNFEIREE